MLTSSQKLGDDGLPRRRSTPLGGGCSVISHTVVGALAALLVIQQRENNSVNVYSEEPVSDDLVARAGALIWAAAAAPGPVGGVALRVIARGCAGGVAALAWDGLAVGAWAAAAPLDCPQRNASLTVLTCERCFFKEGAHVRFEVAPDCSALRLEALSGGADGTLYAPLAFPNASALDAGLGGETLGGLAVSWAPGALLEKWANGPAGAQQWGWRLLRGPAAAARRGLTSEAVAVTIALPLWPTFKSVTVMANRDALELVAELSGLLTIYSVFAVLLWALERAPGCPEIVLRFRARLTATSNEALVVENPLRAASVEQASPTRQAQQPAVPLSF